MKPAPAETRPDVRAAVLALQGSCEPHAAMLRRIGCDPILVRRPDQLAEATHLILPGGESTTIRSLLERYELLAPLESRLGDGSLVAFGTCAGAILLGRDDGTRPARLGAIDVTVDRNAYGTQLDSFRAEVSLAKEWVEAGDASEAADATDPNDSPFPGIFIRAPRFGETGPGVRVLATYRDEPVMVSSENILAATFHPELTEDERIHRHFLAMQPTSVTTAGITPAGIPTAGHGP